jgi:hypothetical protein
MLRLPYPDKGHTVLANGRGCSTFHAAIHHEYRAAVPGSFHSQSRAFADRPDAKAQRGAAPRFKRLSWIVPRIDEQSAQAEHRRMAARGDAGGRRAIVAAQRRYDRRRLRAIAGVGSWALPIVELSAPAGAPVRTRGARFLRRHLSRDGCGLCVERLGFARCAPFLVGFVGDPDGRADIYRARRLPDFLEIVERRSRKAMRAAPFIDCL